LPFDFRSVPVILVGQAFLTDHTMVALPPSSSRLMVNGVKRIPLTISLLDEGGSATMVWSVKNAWPTKITGTDLKSNGNEVAIESIEIVHEGIAIDNP
jgi:phage tail-like protein